MVVERMEVEGLMYVTCEVQPLSGMGCVLPGAEEARDEGAEDERALPDDMRQHGARTRAGGTREGDTGRSSDSAERTEDTEEDITRGGKGIAREKE